MWINTTLSFGEVAAEMAYVSNSYPNTFPMQTWLGPAFRMQ